MEYNAQLVRQYFGQLLTDLERLEIQTTSGRGNYYVLSSYQQDAMRDAHKAIVVAIDVLAMPDLRDDLTPRKPPTEAQRAACLLGGCKRSACKAGDPCCWSPEHEGD